MEAYERVQKHMNNKYGKKLEDLEISDVKGYWKDKYFCGGKGKCFSPLHRTMFNDDPVKHTYYFVEYGRDEKGRFLKPYRAWEELKKMDKK